MDQNPKVLAIDLMIEDLHTRHHQIRSIANRYECIDELEDIKKQLIDYLHTIRNQKNV
jgi:hypothetical protein